MKKHLHILVDTQKDTMETLEKARDEAQRLVNELNFAINSRKRAKRFISFK